MVSQYKRMLTQLTEDFLYNRQDESWMPDDQDVKEWEDLVEEFYKEMDGAIWDRWCEWSAKHSVASAEAKLAEQRHV